MDKQRWEEIHLEEGYSQYAIDLLWKNKPELFLIEDMSEDTIVATCKHMKDKYPNWATRESDEEYKGD